MKIIVKCSIIVFGAIFGVGTVYGQDLKKENGNQPKTVVNVSTPMQLADTKTEHSDVKTDTCLTEVKLKSSNGIKSDSLHLKNEAMVPNRKVVQHSEQAKRMN